jgi:peptidoglycan/xylan/chitin deacetylase (PgdA/CDA1 family)
MILLSKQAKIVPLVLHKVILGQEFNDWEDISISNLDYILDIIGESSTILKNIKPHESSWCLTFDDGYSSNYEIVFPRLLAQNIAAIFFIVLENVGKKGFLTWPQITEMHNHGMEFGSHSVSHKEMSALSDKLVSEEFIQSKLSLEDRIGGEVTSFSYPYGDYSRKTHELGLKAGYQTLFTSDHGLHSKTSSICPRNNIYSGMSKEVIRNTMYPSLNLQLRWFLEDRLKKTVKYSIGNHNYKRLRDNIYL